MDAPIKYAKSGDVHIAYRIFGEGPRDIVLIPGTLSHVEVFWEFAAEEYLLKRLTSFARVIVFDKRGQGLSDRVVSEQTLDERIGDVRAVMIGLQVRTGLHTGECELIGDDVGGIAVHIGSRVSAEAAPGEVLVSGTVKDLVAGSGLRFADQGLRSLKGVPGEWRLYAVQ